MATRRTSRTARADSAFELAAKVAGLPTQPGLGAIKAEYRAGVALRSGHRHTASLDIDTAFLATEPTSSRWDYGIGMRSEAGQELLVWLEAHPASSTGEVQKMLDKLAWLKAKLAGALVVLVDGELVLYVERGGRTLLTWTDDDRRLGPAATALAAAATRGSLGRLTVERADGEQLLGRGTTPLRTALDGAGFVATPKGLRLRA